jgi:hypothetical protein
VSFGFEFKLLAASRDATVTLTMVVVPPKPGLDNPATQQRFAREEWQPAPRRAGDVTLVGYTLEHGWEAMPGLWRFEIWHKDSRLGVQSFCLVTEDQPQPENRSDAKAEDRCPSVPTA